jgi:hypothetical protein
LPEFIGHFPRFGLCHRHSKRGTRAWKVIIVYLRIGS